MEAWPISFEVRARKCHCHRLRQLLLPASVWGSSLHLGHFSDISYLSNWLTDPKFNAFTSVEPIQCPPHLSVSSHFPPTFASSQILLALHQMSSWSRESLSFGLVSLLSRHQELRGHLCDRGTAEAFLYRGLVWRMSSSLNAKQPLQHVFSASLMMLRCWWISPSLLALLNFYK